ncbi:MoxR family ATPase [bacterium]|jgi:MoxR-like ATPase|nr:MoxR family ATPase [bacterium]
MEQLDLSKVRHDLGSTLKYRSGPGLGAKVARTWRKRLEGMMKQVRTKLVGQDLMLETLILGILADGHVLLEGPPGVGKSTAVQAISETLNMEMRKVRRSADFIGANLLVLEEFHHVDPEFRANLLFAMQEGRVLFQNDEIYLDKPFLVFATLNPDSGGSYSLSMAQLDRFVLYHQVPFNSPAEELQILHLYGDTVQQRALRKVFNASEILEMQRLVEKIKIPDSLATLIVDLVVSTRAPLSTREVGLGSEFQGLATRSVLDLARVSQARAFLNGRCEIERDDIKVLLRRTLKHKMTGVDEAYREGILNQMEENLES